MGSEHDSLFQAAILDREELMPFLGAIDEEQLSLQLERLEDAPLRQPTTWR